MPVFEESKDDVVGYHSLLLPSNPPPRSTIPSTISKTTRRSSVPKTPLKRDSFVTHPPLHPSFLFKHLRSSLPVPITTFLSIRLCHSSQMFSSMKIFVTSRWPRLAFKVIDGRKDMTSYNHNLRFTNHIKFNVLDGRTVRLS